MTQHLFAAETSPSLVQLDANFTDLYAPLVVSAGYFVFPGKTDIGAVTPGIVVENASIGYGRINVTKGLASGTGTTYAAVFYYNNTTVGAIGCTSTTTTYVTSSDRRMKRNILPAGGSGALIDEMQVVSHGWKEDAEHSVRFGFIAQDLNSVFPEAVVVGDDGVDIAATWGVDNSKLVPLLVRELQAVRARLAALEAR